MSEEDKHDIQDQQRVRLAQTGIEGESFIRSRLGQSIFARIDREVDQLMLDLINADPDNAKEQRDIRTEIKIRTMFKQYVMEAVKTGQNAAQDLEDVETPEY